MTTMHTTPEGAGRPIGFWLTAVDRLLADAFATAFRAEGATRRDWRLLNVIDGTMPARRPLRPHKLHDLIDRGWVAADGDGWSLTDDGRAAKQRLADAVDGIRATVAEAVSEEEMATTLAALEKIARAFHWDEGTELPRRPHRRHGHRPRGRGFAGRTGHPFPHRFPHRAMATGFGHCDARAEGHDEGHPGHDGHAAGPCGSSHPMHGHADHHRRGEQRLAERAFARGFESGFRHGRDA